jgi:hypothetical protein
VFVFAEVKKLLLMSYKTKSVEENNDVDVPVTDPLLNPQVVF